MLAFAAAILLGTALLMLPVSKTGDGHASFMEALFTSTSAVCVTGHAVVDTASYWSTFGQVVIMLLVQLGGLGIMSAALVVFMLAGRRMGLRRRMIAAEEAGVVNLSDVRRILVGLVAFSLTCEAVIATFLTLRFMEDASFGTALWRGTFHAVSSFNNAGFALWSDSLMGFDHDWFVLGPVALGIIVGGIGYPVFLDLKKNRRRVARWSLHTKITLTATGLLLAVVGGGVIAATLLIPRGPGQHERRQFGPDAVLGAWEGWEATTLVVQTRSDRGLVSNGRMIQARPALRSGGQGVGSLMPKPVDSVLLVGFGTGLFAQGVLEGSQARQLVIVEIDSTQYNSAAWFGVESLLTDPRVVPVVDDALHYLAVTDQTFDLIAVDAWGPEASSAVYTKEFHERALARSRPNGGLWAKLNALDEGSLRAVVDAVRCTWPYTALLGPPEQPEAVLGSRLPFQAMEGLRLVISAEPCQPLRHLYPRRMRTPTQALPSLQVGRPG